MTNSKMKVLIVGNCSTRAFTEFFKKCFPNWETRAVLLVQANDWVEEQNEAFLSYVESADVFVGLTDRECIKSIVPTSALNVFIPSFDFFGYLPDCIFLPGITSPLGLGVIHSRIAASAYLAGRNEEETLKLFNKEHFNLLGYFDEFDKCRDKLLSKFNAHDIDLSEKFESWTQDGNFLYTVNHPHTSIFFDIVHIAMKNHFPDMLNSNDVESARLTVENYMADSVIWPMYPEIAEYHGLVTTPDKWRTSQIHEQGKHMNLEQFIHSSFELYKGVNKFTESTISKLGGMNEIRRLAGYDSLDANVIQQA